jgi:Molybdopterin-binding domain of aldehyde dehydrogenase
MLYAAPNRQTRHRRAKLDLPRADSMRAPGDVIGLLALECAMDELAEALAIDPVELRLRNDTSADPETKQPFSSRDLARALRQGAARFGWERRVAKPARVRDGQWLVGLGVASAIRADTLRNATARARFERDGRLLVELAITDIGTRHLHDLDADRRRDHGDAGRSCDGSHGRHEFSADRRLRRLFWGGNFRVGSACGVSQAQGWTCIRNNASGGILHGRRAKQYRRLRKRGIRIASVRGPRLACCVHHVARHRCISVRTLAIGPPRTRPSSCYRRALVAGDSPLARSLPSATQCTFATKTTQFSARHGGHPCTGATMWRAIASQLNERLIETLRGEGVRSATQVARVMTRLRVAQLVARLSLFLSPL